MDRKLICIWQVTHVRLYLFTSNEISSDFKSDSHPKIEQNNEISKAKSKIVLSEYVEFRWLHKSKIFTISTVGVDPAYLQDERLDSPCLPPIEASDLVSYLVLETSFYTLK